MRLFTVSVRLITHLLKELRFMGIVPRGKELLIILCEPDLSECMSATGDIFRSDKLVNDKNVTIKFVSEENVENLKVKFKEVYDFYLSSQTTIFEDIYKIKVQVENLDGIKVLIS